MTLDKAIEILANHQAEDYKTEATDIHFAIKLGVEALKEIKWIRFSDADYFNSVLPSETES